MAAKFRLEGGSNTTATVVSHDRHEPGLVVYSHPIDHYTYNNSFMTNPTYGASLAIDPTGVAASITPVHDGEDTTLWTASNVQGGGFVFDSTDQSRTGLSSVDATGATNNEIASFTAPAPEQVAGYSSLRCYMYLESFPTSGTKDVTIQIFDSGAPISLEVSVTDYLDILSFNNWQLVDIPFSDFGISGSTTFNEIRLRTVDSGKGTAPAYYLDDLGLVQSGSVTGTESYRFTPTHEELHSLLRLRLVGYNSTSTTPNPTLFFGEPALNNGLSLVLRNRTRVLLSLSIRDLWDLKRFGNTTLSVEPDGATGATFTLDFDIALEHLLIDGATGAFLELTVRDDLTALDLFECSLHTALLSTLTK